MPGIGFNTGRRGSTGTGTPGNVATVLYGWVLSGTAVDLDALQPLLIIDGVQQYFVVPPAFTPAASSPESSYNFVIAEPVSQPQKTAALWIRNAGTVFVNQPVDVGNIFSPDMATGYRIYRSSDILGIYCNGSYTGPVFLQKESSSSGGTSGGGGEVLPTNVYAYWVGLGATPCDRDSRIMVWSYSNVFEAGIELFLNRAMTLPAGSGLVRTYEPLAGTTVNIDGEIFTITAGTVGASTGNIC